MWKQKEIADEMIEKITKTKTETDEIRIHRNVIVMLNYAGCWMLVALPACQSPPLQHCFPFCFLCSSNFKTQIHLWKGSQIIWKINLMCLLRTICCEYNSISAWVLFFYCCFCCWFFILKAGNIWLACPTFEHLSRCLCIGLEQK